MSQQNLIAGLKRAHLPRPEGDGMDNEILRQQDLIGLRKQGVQPLKTQNLGGHRNLKTSPSTTIFTKSQSALDIPHEPVRGAVKGLEQKTTSLRPSANAWGLDKACRKPIRLGLKSQQSVQNDNIAITESNKKTYRLINAETNHSKVDFKEHANNEKKLVAKKLDYIPNNKEIIKTVKIPLYDAPGHGNYAAHPTLARSPQQKQQESKESKANLVSQNNSHNSKEDCIVHIDKSDKREVEGQTESEQKLSQLNNKIETLQDQLQMQIKINTDLKKLLVASVGDDLHHKVECLIRTNAQLATDVGGYSNKINQDGEDIDHLVIQADLWRSKYHASRLQVEQLMEMKSFLMSEVQDSLKALNQLMQERQELKQNSMATYRLLQQLSDAFEPLPPSNRSQYFGPKTNLEFATRIYNLADNIKFRLLGAIQIYPNSYSMSSEQIFTPAENAAMQILIDNKGRYDIQEHSSTQSVPKTTLQRKQETFSRYSPHPYTRYDNILFNCCSKCNGEVQLV